jgi:hypothetical protein
LSNVGRARLAWSESNPKTLFALVSTADHLLRGLYVTSDEGVHWAKIDGVPDLLRGQGFYHMALALHPRADDIVFLGGAGDRRRDESSLYRLERRGNRWIPSAIGGEMHVDFHAVVFDPADVDRVFAANDGGIWRSEDGGGTWSDCNDGLGITQVISLAQHPWRSDIMLAGTQDNGTLRHQGAAGWLHVDNGDGGAVMFDPQTPNIVYNVFLGHRLARSDDGGRAGSFVPSYPDVSVTDSAFLSPYDINLDRPSELVLGADRVYLSSNRGRTWQRIDYRFADGGDGLRRVVISAVRWLFDDVIVVGTSNGQIFKLVRDQGTWAVMRVADGVRWGGEASVAALVPDTRADELLVALDTRERSPLWRVHLSHPVAAPVDLSAGLAGPVFTAAVHPCDAELMFAGTESGVFVSRGMPARWERLGRGLPTVPAFALVFDLERNYLRIGTFGRGVWEISVSSLASCVKDPPATELDDHSARRGS